MLDKIKGFLEETIIKGSIKYLKYKLWENSEDFKVLERLVEESKGKISWEGLIKYTKIENGKVEGIYRSKFILKAG